MELSRNVDNSNELNKVRNYLLEVFRTLYFFLRTFALAGYRNFVPTNWQKKKSLNEKVVLITGAGGGIGSELAQQLSYHNVQLVLWDNNKELLSNITKRCCDLGAKVADYVIDITNREDVYKLGTRVCEKFGRVDILINNAAVLNPHNFLDVDDKRMDLLVDVNVKSLFWVTKAFLPKMLEKNNGHIVCVSSVSSFAGCPGLVDYSTSKFAASGFMEALQHELLISGHTNIKFSTICPMFVRTAMLENFHIFDSNLIVLTAKNVAEKIIEAIQLEQQYMVIPSYMGLLSTIKGSLRKINTLLTSANKMTSSPQIEDKANNVEKYKGMSFRQGNASSVKKFV